jgi:formate hydrogenlyase transcriptional activator
MTDLSARLISVTPETIDNEIIRAQQHIVKSLGLDRSTLFQLQEGTWALTHSWVEPGLDPFPGFAVKNATWTQSVLARGEVMQYARIDDMPEEATVEKDLQGSRCYAYWHECRPVCD